jgi:uncharacterized membrane protein
MTADTSNSSPAIQVLFLILIPALFVTSFVVVELVPGWQRTLAMLNRRRLLGAGLALAVFGIVWLLIGLREIEKSTGDGSHPRLFGLYLISFLVCAGLLKLVYERTRH